MKQVRKIARDMLDMGESFAAATIVDTYGSTPRSKGAVLLMAKDGKTYGTIGGGALEAMAEKMCQDIFRTKKGRTMRFQLHEEDKLDMDMRCGGDAEVRFEYVDSEPILEDLFGPLNNSVAYIFGGGHVGKAIEPLLRYVDFTTVVLDDRKEYAGKERFPDAERLIVLENYEQAFKGLSTDSNSYIIIVTRGHRGDYHVLKNALEHKAAYIGMIGSRTKVAEIMEKLKQDGFSREQLEKVYTPIGLPIFAETPKEIGISIVAQMIMVRAGHGK